MRSLSCSPGARVFVFSHPNHELAVAGLVRRLQPHVVYLTDGGGPDRVAETRAGLRRIGHAAPVRYLDVPEAALYRALLDGDVRTFEALVSAVREVVDEADPVAVFCDAVERYNPVHDMALPVARAALGGRDVPVFEIPLVHQVPAEAERYRLQRVPASRRDAAEEIVLTPAEREAKREARSAYGILTRQLGPLCDQDDGLFEREEVLRNEGALPPLVDDVVLRYEWRGDVLRRRGEVARVIRHDAHWLPAAHAVLDVPADVGR